MEAGRTSESSTPVAAFAAPVAAFRYESVYVIVWPGDTAVRPVLVSVRSGDPGAAAGFKKLRLPAPLTCRDAPVKACAPASRRVLKSISPALLLVKLTVKV